MKGMALILYNNIEYAQAAVKDTKGWKIGGSKIKVNSTEFVSFCNIKWFLRLLVISLESCIDCIWFFSFRWTLPIRKARWLFIARCRLLARIFGTFMTSLQKEGLYSLLKELCNRNITKLITTFFWYCFQG